MFFASSLPIEYVDASGNEVQHDAITVGRHGADLGQGTEQELIARIEIDPRFHPVDIVECQRSLLARACQRSAQSA